MNKTQLEAQIVHLLRVYPVLSPTLIQNLLGSKVKAAIWRPIVEEMIKDGVLERKEIIAENAYGQFRRYTQITHGPSVDLIHGSKPSS